MHLLKVVVGLVICSQSFARSVPQVEGNGCAVPQEHYSTPLLMALPEDQYRLSEDPSVFNTPTNVSRTSAEKLRKAVEDDYFLKLPTTLKLEQRRDNVTAYKVADRLGQGGAYMGVDIVNLKMDTCKTVMSDVQELAPGIVCTHETCSQTYQISTESSYSVTNGYKAGATLTGKVGLEGIAEIEMSVSFETSYEAQWSHAQSTTNTYQFNLKEGERCTPSMIHVDLECKSTAGKYQWDSWWVDKGYLNLEGNWVRPPHGPYAHNQWCTELWLKQSAINEPAMDKRWKALLDYDHYRGWLYMHATTDLNQYIDFPTYPVPRLTDDEIVIRRDSKDSEYKNKAWRCSRPTQFDKDATIRVPLRGHSGELLGFIGCL